MARFRFVFLLIFFIIYCKGKDPSLFGVIDSPDGMRLRETPATSGLQIGYLPDRAKVKILDRNGPEETLYNKKARWYKVEYLETTGWTFGGFVKVVEDDFHNEKTLGIVDTQSGMNMRAGPGTSNEQIGYVPNLGTIAILDLNGPEETIYDIKSKWFRVEYQGKTGWMFGGFVKIISPSSGQLPPAQNPGSPKYCDTFPECKNLVDGKDLPADSHNRLITGEINSTKIQNCVSELLRSYHGESGKVLAVFPPTDTGGISAHQVALINSLIVQNVLGDGRFQITERQALSQVLKEQQFQQSGLTSEAAQMGKIAGAQLLLLFGVHDGILDFRIVDTDTATVKAFAGANLFE